MFRNKSDRHMFVSILEDSKQKYGFDLYGYCLLDNDEFWIILNAKRRSISTIMQSISISYALYRDDTKNLFENRYHSDPLYTLEALDEEVSSLKSDIRYESCSYCFYDPKENIPLPFISDIDNDISIREKHSQILNESEFDKLMESLIQTIDIEDDNKESRNTLIKKIYAEYNVTQKQLANYFSLTSSSISKILKS